MSCTDHSVQRRLKSNAPSSSKVGVDSENLEPNTTPTLWSHGSFYDAIFPPLCIVPRWTLERACYNTCQRSISFTFWAFQNPTAMPTVHDWINNPLGVVDGLFGKTQQSKYYCMER